MKRRIILFLILFIICIGGLLIPYFGGLFILSLDHGEKLIYYHDLAPGEKIEYSSIHSVSLTPIAEIWETTEQSQFRLIEVRYIDQGGAGLPEYTWEDQVFVKNDNGFVLRNFNRYFKELEIIVQEEYKNRLSFGKERVDLYRLLKEEGTVRLKYDKLSLLHKLYINFIVKPN